MNAVASPIRLAIQQPSLAKYRVPVFRELARRDGIALKLYYGERTDLPNVSPHGFVAEMVPLRQRQLCGHWLFWHRAQWDCALRRQADVLMLTWNTRYMSLIPALLRARANGVPTILWGHGYSKHERSWGEVARASVAKLATALLFYNGAAAQRFIGLGWDPRRIFVAPNSLDQAPIRDARRAWNIGRGKLKEFREKERLPKGRVVLYVSRLDPANRLDLLVQATARLKERYGGIQVIIIGRGDAEAARLKQLAARLGVADRIHFKGAIYDEMQLAPWFLCADVFCYPANIGLSLLHAFGYGLPVVTSDRIAIQNPEIDALRNGVNGLLYADGDATALADTLQRILTDPQGAQEMSAAALRTVEEDFTIESMVDGMEAAVRYCAGETSRGRSRSEPRL